MIKRFLDNGDSIINYEIGNGTYNYFTINGFFGFDDVIRLIKMIHIFISFFLNLLIIISILKNKKLKFTIAFNLTANILIINFIHTCTYILNWVKNINYEFNDEKSNNTYTIGGLLIGNPKKNFFVCQIQGFLLVYSSLSQDISIILLFYHVNKTTIPSKFNIQIKLLIFAHFLPFLLSVIYLLIGGIGLNDRYCYIKKFEFNSSNSEPYSIYDNFRALIIITYTIRGINLGISIYLLIIINRYVKKHHLRKIYILKTYSILIVQIIIISIGFIYRLSQIISNNKNNKHFSNIFLCINTIDGILFPLSYSLSNGIYQNLCQNHSFNESLDSLMVDSDGKDDLKSSSSRSLSQKNNTFAMIEIRDDEENNFDLSYI